MLSLTASKKRTLDTLALEKEPLPPPLTASTLQDTDNDEILSSGSSSSDSSDSDSDSSSDSDSDSDSTLGSEFEEVSKEALDALLSKARENLRAKSEKSKGKQRAFNTEDDEIKLVESEDEAEKEQEDPARPLPQLDPGMSFKSYFNYDSKNKGESDTEGEDESSGRRSLKKKLPPPPSLRNIEAEALEAEAGPSSVPAPPLPPPELAKDGKRLTKKEIKAQKKRTAEPGWFDLPTPDAADLPRLYREVEALRLRNTLDPKRFYRKEPGEGKGVKGLPHSFAIGTIVPTSTPFGTASSENLTRAERKRTLVDELVDDAEAKRYAKRKFDDFQSSRAAKGRGTFAKRFAGRKPKW